MSRCEQPGNRYYTSHLFVIACFILESIARVRYNYNHAYNHGEFVESSLSVHIIVIRYDILSTTYTDGVDKSLKSPSPPPPPPS